MTKKSEESIEDQEMTIVEHLIDLRKCVIRILIGLLVVTLLLVPFYKEIYNLFAIPVMNSLLPDQKMLAHKAIDVFLTPVKVCIFLAVLFNIPWIIMQIWNFVAPGMYKHEKKVMVPIIVSGTVLFYVGVLFAYFVILPLMFHFLTGIHLNNVEFMPDISDYLSLSLKLFLAFGIAFEVPVATVILIMMNVVKIETLTARRPYIILAAFVVAMFLTPPDVFSQTLLAVPMLILFEIAILIAKRLKRKEQESQNKD